MGVGRDAGQDEIKAAWRNMAKVVHPDTIRATRWPTPLAGSATPDVPSEGPEEAQSFRQRRAGSRSQAERKQNENTIMAQRQAAREAIRAKQAQENAERVMEELALAGGAEGGAEAAKQPQQQQQQQQQTGAAEPAEEMIERIFGTRAAPPAAADGQQLPGRPSVQGPRVPRPTSRRTSQTRAPKAGVAGKACWKTKHAEEAAAAASAVLQPLSLLTSFNPPPPAAPRRCRGAGSSWPSRP